MNTQFRLCSSCGWLLYCADAFCCLAYRLPGRMLQSVFYQNIGKGDGACVLRREVLKLQVKPQKSCLVRILYWQSDSSSAKGKAVLPIFDWIDGLMRCSFQGVVRRWIRERSKGTGHTTMMRARWLQPRSLIFPGNGTLDSSQSADAWARASLPRAASLKGGLLVSVYGNIGLRGLQLS